MSGHDRAVVAVTRAWPEAAERALRARFDARLNASDEPLPPERLRALLASVDALCPTVSDRITAEVLSAEPLRARVIANFGVGVDHIDLEAARARGLVVTNTPGVLTDCTADLAMTLLLMVARRAGEGERHLRAGHWTGWRPTHLLGTRVGGKRLGLVGFGRIARAVAHRARHGFGMRIAWYNPSPVPEEVTAPLQAERCASVDELVAGCDFVSLHCPGGAATRHLIDARRLSLMPRHAFLVNTARGDVVDEAALVAALEAGEIAGAALDVYEREPAVHPGLIGREDVVLLPHLGSATTETRTAMGLRVVENLSAFFAGREPPDRVV